MRHFSHEVALLTGSVVDPALIGLLITGSGTAERVTSCLIRALPRAITVPSITMTADPDLTMAPGTIEKPVALLNHHSPLR
jgi:hypothetical protein